jgi:hypothetical protein
MRKTKFDQGGFFLPTLYSIVPLLTKHLTDVLSNSNQCLWTVIWLVTSGIVLDRRGLQYLHIQEFTIIFQQNLKEDNILEYVCTVSTNTCLKKYLNFLLSLINCFLSLFWIFSIWKNWQKSSYFYKCDVLCRHWSVICRLT